MNAAAQKRYATMRGGLKIGRTAKEAVAISPMLNAAEQMFAETASASSRNRRQKLAFILLTLLIAVGGALAARLFVAERNLVFAVSHKGSSSDLFAHHLQEIVSRGRGVRITIKNFDSPTAAAQQFAQLQADIAIIRSDTKTPPRGRAVAQLEHSILLIAVPKSAVPKSISALKGKKLAMIATDARDQALVRSILGRFDIPDTTPLEQRKPDEWASLFEPGGPAAVFFMARKSGLAENRFWLGKNQKVNFKLIDLDGAKGIADRMHGVENEKIEAGEIFPSPPVPEEETETVAVDDILIARQGLPDTVGRALVAAIFENKDQLAIPGRYATNIEPPNTEKEAAVLAHPAAAAYFEDQSKTFFDRYSDMLFLVLWISGLVGSAFLWLYSQVTRVTPIEAGRLADTFRDLAMRAAEAPDVASVASIEGELNRLLTKTLAGLRDGSVSYDGFEAYRLTFDLARSAIAERKRALGPAAT